jgi:hypothetical protein
VFSIRRRLLASTERHSLLVNTDQRTHDWLHKSSILEAVIYPKLAGNECLRPGCRNIEVFLEGLLSCRKCPSRMTIAYAFRWYQDISAMGWVGRRLANKPTPSNTTRYLGRHKRSHTFRMFIIHYISLFMIVDVHIHEVNAFFVRHPLL